MADIFLSYARGDNLAAKQMVETLESEGLSVFWDEITLAPGEKWDQVIEEQLEKAKAVVVLWTPTSVTSAWVREEASYAREQGKLIPITLDEVQVPSGFREMHAVNWSGRKDYSGLNDIRASIKNFVPGKTPK